MPKKTYLFITDTFYNSTNLTGAHCRFLELVREVSKTCNIILVSRDIPQLNDLIAVRYKIGEKKRKYIPYHINGMLDICKTLKRIKKKIQYDYAISFSVNSSYYYKICGYKNVISIFRDDFIGYKEVLNTSKTKLLYSKWIEKKAVSASDKIIVQCKSDRNNIIKRNRKYCKDIEKKVFIQINNANASWMNENIEEKEEKSNKKITGLFIGDFSNKRKGHEILLPAFARLIDNGIKAELIVAGNGKDLDKYRDKYINYTDIKFLGRVSNISHYLSISNYEIVPSLIDSCPNTVLEGLNAGIAVYGSNTGGIPDLLLNEKYLFNPTEESVYKFLENIIQNKKYIQDTIDQRKIREKLTFNWGQKIKEIIER